MTFSGKNEAWPRPSSSCAWSSSSRQCAITVCSMCPPNRNTAGIYLTENRDITQTHDDIWLKWLLCIRISLTAKNKQKYYSHLLKIMEIKSGEFVWNWAHKWTLIETNTSNCNCSFHQQQQFDRTQEHDTYRDVMVLRLQIQHLSPVLDTHTNVDIFACK